MIKEDYVFIKVNKKNLKYFKERGYNIDLYNENKISVKDLHNHSVVEISAVCDLCGNEKKIKYRDYYKNFIKINFYSCIKCVNEKRKKCNFKKYGVEHTFQLTDVKEKIKKTNIEIYKCNSPIQSEDIKNKIKKTNIEKYGVEYGLQNIDVRNKIRQTNLKKYGVSNHLLSNIKENIIKSNETKKHNIFLKYEDLLKGDYVFIDYNDSIFTIKHNECKNNFKLSINNLIDRYNSNICLCTECYPISEQKSIKEKEMIKWINQFDVNFIKSDKTVLNPKHLDIYIPTKNIAIEFNGLYYHSEYFKNKNYHLDKSLDCESKGIHLLHIWEDEWLFKQDIVKSIILNKIGLISEKIYARQCEVRDVEDSKLIRCFLDTNHIQGYTQSSIKLGLFYNNELVSLMTFGYRHTNSKKEFELIRFCNKINLNVIGAASKLFNYFKKNYDFKELISYSDFRLFDGAMYETLGFTKQHLSKPDYFWCKNLERKHRFNFNKQKLIKEGYDPNKTEVEIMHERGYFRVFGCGQYRWKYSK